MSKEFKYIMNMGLAFDEDRVMKKLSKMAKEGWILEEMTGFRYKLVKDEPTDLVYTMDYKKMDGNEREYFDLFKSCNWKHMCSYGDFHFFAAPSGEVPIYTDKKSYLEKYSSYKKGCKKSIYATGLVFLAAFILEFMLGSEIEGSIISYVLLLITVFSVIILVPSIMMFVAFSFKEKKAFLK